jgi:hypothetical protein
MSFTTSQFNKFINHRNFTWLLDRQKRSIPVSQDTVRLKIKQAIQSAFQDRGTETNIQWVADKKGIFYGQVPRQTRAATGKVHVDAVAEVRGTDAHMAKAVRMIFQGTAKGRSAPGTTGINHIHVGGYGTKNILFDTRTNVVLGVVDGHMEKGMSSMVRSQASQVNGRKGGNTRAMKVVGNTVS